MSFSGTLRWLSASLSKGLKMEKVGNVGLLTTVSDTNRNGGTNLIDFVALFLRAIWAVNRELTVE